MSTTTHISDAQSPLCYNCKHRGQLTTTHHSECNHPSLSPSLKAQLMLIGISFPNGYDRLADYLKANKADGIMPVVTGNHHGIKNGWFSWPMNFDPIWLQTCSGFEAIETTKKGGE